MLQASSAFAASAATALEAFEADRERQWLVERDVEIVSEASRRPPPELKSRHPEIPWQKVAGVGNVLRHDYESIAAAVMWKLARNDLDALQQARRAQLNAAEGRGST